MEAQPMRVAHTGKSIVTISDVGIETKANDLGNRVVVKPGKTYTFGPADAEARRANPNLPDAELDIADADWKLCKERQAVKTLLSEGTFREMGR
jgi:hypothetical protein